MILKMIPDGLSRQFSSNCQKTYVVRLTIWVCIFATPSGSSVGLMQSVAPSAVAISNLALFISIAKMRPAFRDLAACTHARPTAPRPKTATVAPSWTLQVFQTAPKPVLLSFGDVSVSPTK